MCMYTHVHKNIWRKFTFVSAVKKKNHRIKNVIVIYFFFFRVKNNMPTSGDRVSVYEKKYIYIYFQQTLSSFSFYHTIGVIARNTFEHNK